MSAFNRNKYNPAKFVELVLSNTSIVSYGFITAIDYDTVVVTPAVSNKASAEKIRCTFMNLGEDLFAVIRKPAIGMRVMVFSPAKAASGMYESYKQLSENESRDYIFVSSPAVYSSQFAFCLPAMKATAQALSSIIVDSDIISVEIKHEIAALLDQNIELDFMGDTHIELHEGSKHFRGYYGDLEETFGMQEGASGTEKPGTYVYKKTYGKHSSVEKNYESGIKTVIGKAYEKPFLENKGALVDSSAPVTIELGASAPVTLKFGDNIVVIKADTETGLDIALTGATKVNITAESGKFNFSNANGSLKDILDMVADLCSQINTIGGPAAQSLEPGLALQFSSDLKTLISGVLE
jgi:hypothetical protein